MACGDQILYREVLEELESDPSLKDQAIGIRVEDGVITLLGFVDSEAMRRAAVEAVDLLDGARAVVDRLKVDTPDPQQATDAELEFRIGEFLNWDVHLQDLGIRASVENGILTLEGQVESLYQQGHAGLCLSRLRGVRGVINLLTVPRHDSVDHLRTMIEEALVRRAHLDAEGISVETEGTIVTLSGTVPSHWERHEAIRVARLEPGVTDVIDHIEVELSESTWPGGRDASLSLVGRWA